MNLFDRSSWLNWSYVLWAAITWSNVIFSVHHVRQMLLICLIPANTNRLLYVKLWYFHELNLKFDLSASFLGIWFKIGPITQGALRNLKKLASWSVRLRTTLWEVVIAGRANLGPISITRVSKLLLCLYLWEYLDIWWNFIEVSRISKYLYVKIKYNFYHRYISWVSRAISRVIALGVGMEDMIVLALWYC